MFVSVVDVPPVFTVDLLMREMLTCDVADPIAENRIRFRITSSPVFPDTQKKSVAPEAIAN